MKKLKMVQKVDFYYINKNESMLIIEYFIRLEIKKIVK